VGNMTMLLANGTWKVTVVAGLTRTDLGKGDPLIKYQKVASKVDKGVSVCQCQWEWAVTRSGVPWDDKLTEWKWQECRFSIAPSFNHKNQMFFLLKKVKKVGNVGKSEKSWKIWNNLKKIKRWKQLKKSK
jgi:hypothetical protein